METASSARMNRLILVLDAVIVLASGAISFAVQPWLNNYLHIFRGTVPAQQYALLIVWWLPLWLAAVVGMGLHRLATYPRSVWQLLWSLLKLHFVCFLALVVIVYSTQLEVNRSLLIIFFFFSLILMYLSRYLVILVLKNQHQKGVTRKNILLVGDMGESMQEFLLNSGNRSFSPHFLGRIIPPGMDNLSKENEQIPILGTTLDFETCLDTLPVDEVAFFAPFNSPSENIELLRACEELGIPAYFSVNMDQPTQASPRFTVQYEKPFVLFDVSPKRADLIAIKHILDVIAAAGMIVVLFPILLLVSFLIFVTMGRPVLFLQKRAGMNGRDFMMLKFRTMKIGAEKERDILLDKNEMDGPVFKISDDPRITCLGKFLRRSSIDELPQLFNVIGGTMSLVGPRPLPVEEQQQIKGWRRRRLSMKPGITGIWQVSGRSDVNFEQWMKMDLQYVDNWNLWLDVAILFRTIKVLVSAKGAR